MPPSESRRGEAATTLPDGAVLVLYTDGLVETRIRTFDDGIGLLSAALAALDPDLTPTQACDTLLNQMISGDPEDDVALLLIRINP